MNLNAISRAALYWILSIFWHTFIIWLIIQYVTVVKMGSYKRFIYSRECRGSILLNVLAVFLENIASWACLFRSGLKAFSHWYAHSEFFFKSLFNLHAQVLASSTIENNVLSIHNLTLDTISFERSLMWIRKKRGPNTDPYGTPGFIGSHSDVWPFKLTLWNLFFKKLLISSTKVLEIHTDLNFKSKTFMPYFIKTLWNI